MTDKNGHSEKPIWQIVNEKFACDHEVVHLRLRGSNQYVYQCDTCGRATTSAIAHDKLNEDEKAKAGRFNPAIQDHWQAARDDYRKSLVEMRSRKMSMSYADWRRGHEWQRQRQRVMHRDGMICQACNENLATEVHHLTYKYHPHTPDFFLQSVCRACHERITARDKGES
jgi:hypothetical protein